MKPFLGYSLGFVVSSILAVYVLGPRGMAFSIIGVLAVIVGHLLKNVFGS